jgi:hypothetical protein
MDVLRPFLIRVPSVNSSSSISNGRVFSGLNARLAGRSACSAWCRLRGQFRVQSRGNLSAAHRRAATRRQEVGEQVIRKMRAGTMPPPGMPRPPLMTYEGVRDWLESEIDKKTTAHPKPRFHHPASPEPHRIQECDPRSSRSGDGCRAAASARRFGRAGKACECGEHFQPGS